MPWDEALVNSLVYDRPDPSEGRVVSYVRAINEALTIALHQDPSVFVLGQGVDDPTAMFGTTKDLARQFGPERVFDTPLSEEAMMGVSAGAAMNGMRPIFMHNRPDFVLLAKSFGIDAARVEEPDDLRSALTNALASGVPYLLDVWTRGDVPMPRTGHWDIAEFLITGND